MIKEKSHNIKLGIFVFTGVLLLIIGLYSIGRNRNMFGGSVTVFALFYDVNGLVPGDNVRYAGINIGTVEEVKIVSDSSVRVRMVIDSETKKFIRKNSIATVGTDGLMGNKLISIGPGSKESPVVEENDELVSLRSVNTEAMLRTLDVTNDNMYVITNNLRTITENVNKSRGTLYTVLNDTTLSKRIGGALRNIETVSKNLVEVSGEIGMIVNNVSSGKGLLGTMISDTVISDDIRQSVARIREGSEQFSLITTDIRTTLNEINAGSGTITTLLKDSAMAGDLKRSLSNLEKASVTLNEELEALKHSFLLRNYYKKK